MQNPYLYSNSLFQHPKKKRTDVFDLELNLQDSEQGKSQCSLSDVQSISGEESDEVDNYEDDVVNHRDIHMSKKSSSKSSKI